MTAIGSLRRDSKVFDISSPADLPAAITAPDGVSRVPIVESAKYIIHETFSWPRLLIPKQTVFGNFEPIDFLGARTEVRMEFDGDDTPHIWGRDIGSVRFDSVGLRDISNAGAGLGTWLFDLVGASGFSLLGTSFLPSEQFKRIASLVDMALEFRPHAISSNQEGYIVRLNPTALFASNLAHQLTGVRFTNPLNTTQTAPQLVFQGDPVNTVVVATSVDQQSGDNWCAIDSGAAASEYVFSAVAYAGTASGNFFRADISKSLTAMADSAIAITAFSNSTADPGVDTTVEFGAIQKFTRGQFILISGATQVSLNGTHQIQRVADDQSSFDIPIVFVTDSTATLEKTTVTAAAHGMVEGETQTIVGTTSYNGTTEILSISDDRNSFDIPVAFVGNDATGTVTSTSKDETSIGVTVSNCGAQPDSRILGFGEMNANATATVVASASTYQAINVGTVVDNPVSERFTLTDATNGVYTYNGSKPISARVTAVVSATKGGATANYRFTTSVNGAIPTFATAAYAPMEVKSAKVAATVSKFVSLVNGDTVQIMGAGDGHSDNFTATDFVIEIDG